MPTIVNDANTPNRWFYMSAYATAVKHGFEGTEEDWLALIYGGTSYAKQYAVAAEAAKNDARLSATSARTDARAAAASAEAAAASEAAAESAAAGAAQEVLDTVPGLVDDWLEDAITNPSNPPLDTTFSLENAAAQSKATGDKIKESLIAVDELGSVFESQNALYLYHQEAKECPEYEFHFDADYDTGRWTSADIEGGTKSAGGYNTSTHPVDVDDSMVLHIPPSASYSASVGVSFCLGYMDDGDFVPVFTRAWTTANKGRIINIRSYRANYASLTEPKIILQTSGSLSLLQGMRLTRSNPFCELTAFPRVSLTNSNVGEFIPSSSRYDGRLCAYYTSRTSKKTKTFVYADDNKSVAVDEDDHDIFVCARQVRFSGTPAHSGSYTISSTEGSEGNLTINDELASGDTLSDGDTVGYDYIVANKAAYERRPWHKWLYANGGQMDAIFYDNAGAEILWYNGEGSVNGCLAWTGDKLYPTLIRIPDDAVSYHFSVYGAVPQSGSPAALGTSLATRVQEICAWGRADHALVPNEAAGMAINNARRLGEWTYPAETIPTRYHLAAYKSSPPAPMKGVLYAPASRLMLGTNISYYTYLSIVKKEHGLSAAGNWRTSNNADFGMMCAAFISASLGLPHYQGAEYFIQKYADKLERIDASTELHVGDILVTTKYYRPKNASKLKKNLDTHISIVSDVLCDRDSGRFIGHVKDEDTNIWTRKTVAKTRSFVAYTSPEQQANTENPEYIPQPNGASRVCEAYTWRLRLTGDDIPEISNSYRFAADKEYDPLTNPNIEFPPVMSRFGDRCVIGTYPVVYGTNQPGYRYPECGYTFFVEKDYKTLNIYHSEDGGATYTTVATGVVVGTYQSAASGTAYYSVDLSSYLTTPGVYKIEAYDENSVKAENDGLFLLPDYPASITRSDDGKIVTISGASKYGDKVRCQGFGEVWLRVIPYPAEHVDGAGDKLPWANYMFIPAAEVWDEENGRIDLGNKYDYVVAMTLFDNDFGGVSYRFTLDNDDPTLDDEDYDGDDGDGGDAP